MDEWQKILDTLVKAFDEFAVKMKEIADALTKAFRFGTSVFKNNRKKSFSPLERYGMSLQKSGGKRPFKRYSYFEIRRKNEPYQRRNYEKK